MENKKKAFEILATSVIKDLEKRNMEGYYFEDSKSCVEAILKMIPKQSKIGWGGTQTFKETGMLEALSNGEYELIDRMKAKTPEESREIFAQTILSDYFFMSANAITEDGILVNIDGNSNRVACLCHGPSHVMVLVGRNKFTKDVESAIARIRTYACPPNAVRLNKSPPCGVMGKSNECLSPECMCNNIVITRRSGHEGRIKVFLINEDLGY